MQVLIIIFVYYLFQNIKFYINYYIVKDSDILFFVECHSKYSTASLCLEDERIDEYNKLDDFDLYYLTGGTNENTSNGIACYIRKGLEINFQFVGDNSDDNGFYSKSTGLVELSMYKFNIAKNESIPNWVYICIVYNHPKSDFKKNFIPQFVNFLELHGVIVDQSGTRDDIMTKIKNQKLQIVKNLYVIGDINFDLNVSQNAFVWNSLIKDGLDFKLQCKDPTTDRGSLIDICMRHLDITTPRVQSKSYVYETYWSDHKPIVTKIEKQN